MTSKPESLFLADILDVHFPAVLVLMCDGDANCAGILDVLLDIQRHLPPDKAWFLWEDGRYFPWLNPTATASSLDALTAQGILSRQTWDGKPFARINMDVLNAKFPTALQQLQVISDRADAREAEEDRRAEEEGGDHDEAILTRLR